MAVEVLLVLRGVPDEERTLSTYRLAAGETVMTTPLQDNGLAALTLRALEFVDGNTITRMAYGRRASR